MMATVAHAPGGGRPSSASVRAPTPPRSAANPSRFLKICLDDHVLGSVEVDGSSTLSDVRRLVDEDEIPRVPEAYLFLFGGAPVSRRQECRRRAADCFPFLVIVPENARIAPPAGTSAAAGQEDGVPTSGTLAMPQSNREAVEGPDAAENESSAAPHPSRARPEVTEAGGPELERESSLGGQLPERGSSPQAGSSGLELQITDGPLEGTTVTVGQEGARIGRHTSNTLVIPEAGISRYHFEIRWVDGSFAVRDLGSTTGTFFYLKPHTHFRMFVGLMVKLGETELQVLSLPGAPSPQGAEELVALFYEGPLAGHKVHIPASGITIGRRHDNNLVLMQDGTVSAHHAAIFAESGEFFLSDLGSCNGTCARLSTERSDSDWHPLLDGDIVGAGCTKIHCRIIH